MKIEKFLKVLTKLNLKYANYEFDKLNRMDLYFKTNRLVRMI